MRVYEKESNPSIYPYVKSKIHVDSGWKGDKVFVNFQTTCGATVNLTEEDWDDLCYHVEGILEHCKKRIEEDKKK